MNLQTEPDGTMISIQYQILVCLNNLGFYHFFHSYSCFYSWRPQGKSCDWPWLAPCRQARSDHPMNHGSLAPADSLEQGGTTHNPRLHSLHHHSRKSRPSQATREGEAMASWIMASWGWVHMEQTKKKPLTHPLAYSFTQSFT